MTRASEAGWWCVEMLIPAVAVLAGVVLLVLAAFAQVTDALPRGDQMKLFLAGVGSWAGGIAWGALVNNGIPRLRDP